MEVSGQKLWLDEAMTHSTGFLKSLVHKENSRDLTNAEKNMKHIAQWAKHNRYDRYKTCILWNLITFRYLRP